MAHTLTGFDGLKGRCLPTSDVRKHRTVHFNETKDDRIYKSLGWLHRVQDTMVLYLLEFCDSVIALTWGHRKYLDKFLTREGPFADPESFMPGEPVIESLSRTKVL